SGQVVDLQIQREEEESVELARVPDDSLTGRGAEEGEQDDLQVAPAREALRQRSFGTFALRLHRLEDRRLLQLKPDVVGEMDQDQGDQEGNSPSPVLESLRTHLPTEETDDDEGHEKSQRRGRLDPARVVAALAVGGVLRDVGRGSAVLPAEREALQEAQD